MSAPPLPCVAIDCVSVGSASSEDCSAYGGRAAPGAAANVMTSPDTNACTETTGVSINTRPRKKTATSHGGEDAIVGMYHYV